VNSNAVTTAYDRKEGDPSRRVGIALSGGGHRASLFALGALMYVHDACLAAPSERRVAGVSSVSGGSITNAACGHGLRLGKDTREDFDKMARELVLHVVRDGSMWSGLSLVYHLFVFLALPIVGLSLAVFLIRQLGWLDALRCLAIFSPLPVALFVIGRHTLGPLARAMLATTLLLGLHLVLADADWRRALSYLAVAGLVLFLAIGLWAWRGRFVQRSIERLLRKITTEPLLAKMGESPHHVLCATEVQMGVTAYLSHDAIRARSFHSVGPGNLRTARAVRASAAFPGAFPPVIIRSRVRDWNEGAQERTAERQATSPYLVLVDGGVRNNLGTDWFTKWAPPLDEIIVVSSAANRLPRRDRSTLPGLSELQALMNLTGILYSTRERNSRRALGFTLGSRLDGRPGPAWAHCHIEDSPFDLANAIRILAAKGAVGSSAIRQEDVIEADEWEVDQHLLATRLYMQRVEEQRELAERADDVWQHLENLEAKLGLPETSPKLEALKAVNAVMKQDQFLGSDKCSRAVPLRAQWWQLVTRSVSLGTGLSGIPEPAAKELIAHGYCLAMANLHIVMGWPLVSDLDRKRLDGLLPEVAGRPAS
jgi:predicted acylesterase/phospholipase RssA